MHQFILGRTNQHKPQIKRLAEESNVTLQAAIGILREDSTQHQAHSIAKLYRDRLDKSHETLLEPPRDIGNLYLLSEGVGVTHTYRSMARSW